MSDILTMMLYCDLSTMKCTSNDINLELDNFAKNHIQLNESLWFFTYSSGFNGSPLQKDEFIFYEYFEKYLEDNSVIFISMLKNRNCMYQLPDNLDAFLEENLM